MNYLQCVCRRKKTGWGGAEYWGDDQYIVVPVVSGDKDFTKEYAYAAAKTAFRYTLANGDYIQVYNIEHDTTIEIAADWRFSVLRPSGFGHGGMREVPDSELYV